jgi:hypothetical protein
MHEVGRPAQHSSCTPGHLRYTNNAAAGKHNTDATMKKLMEGKVCVGPLEGANAQGQVDPDPNLPLTCF